MVSTIPEDSIWLFSARQVTSFPMSSMVAVIDSRLVVVLWSCEVISSECFSLFVPIHHDMVAGGRDPDEMHESVEILSADNGFRSPTIFTLTGRTETENI